MSNKRFTVFTSTFNRGYLLEQLFISLKKQSFRDFEWVVIDDGSTDQTEHLFNCFRLEQLDFPIRYEKVQNGGKHRAINRGLQMAEGELFFIVDSDDYLTECALEIVDRIEKTISSEDKKNFAGVCGLKGYSEKVAVGSTFHGSEYLDATSLDRQKLSILGDKAEVFYTSILRMFPFPEFEGENFLTECVVWDKIAYAGYQLRFFNEIIYICDYLEDGLSVHSSECFRSSPLGMALFVRQSIEYGKITGVDKWRERRNYYNMFKNEMTARKIAKLLGVRTISLLLHSWGLRIIYWLYR